MGARSCRCPAQVIDVDDVIGAQHRRCAMPRKRHHGVWVVAAVDQVLDAAAAKAKCSGTRATTRLATTRPTPTAHLLPSVPGVHRRSERFPARHSIHTTPSTPQRSQPANATAARRINQGRHLCHCCSDDRKTHAGCSGPCPHRAAFQPAATSAPSGTFLTRWRVRHRPGGRRGRAG
jgi:hypothetical protein